MEGEGSAFLFRLSQKLEMLDEVGINEQTRTEGTRGEASVAVDERRAKRVRGEMYCKRAGRWCIWRDRGGRRGRNIILGVRRGKGRNSSCRYTELAAGGSCNTELGRGGSEIRKKQVSVTAPKLGPVYNFSTPCKSDASQGIARQRIIRVLLLGE